MLVVLEKLDASKLSAIESKMELNSLLFRQLEKATADVDHPTLRKKCTLPEFEVREEARKALEVRGCDYLPVSGGGKRMRGARRPGPASVDLGARLVGAESVRRYGRELVVATGGGPGSPRAGCRSRRRSPPAWR